MMRLSPQNIRDKLLYGYLGHVPRDRPFVFGIGLSKTGTTSLNDALEVLGYHAFHLPPIVRIDAGGAPQMDIPWWVYKYNALTDITVSVFHKELQSHFPNARLIYTRRDMDSWLNSCRRHFTKALAEMRVKQNHVYINDLCTSMYGAAVFDEQSYRDAYLRFDAEVMEHHKDKESFMVFDLIAGDGWDKLCGFLSKPVPQTPFPISNVGARQS